MLCAIRPSLSTDDRRVFLLKLYFPNMDGFFDASQEGAEAVPQQQEENAVRKGRCFFFFFFQGTSLYRVPL